MASSGSERPLVLFDLDGVVTTRDTMAAVVRQRLFAQPWRLVLAAPAVVTLLLTDRWSAVRAHPARLLVRIALLGQTADQARRYLTDTGTRLGAAVGWVHADALTAMRRHREAGDRVVVVTASSADLARALLRAAGAPDVEVVGSGLADAPAGPRLRPHAFHDGKLTALARAGVPVASACVYTDSLADLPLMRHSQAVTLVNPSPRLARAVRRALRQTVSPIVWC